MHDSLAPQANGNGRLGPLGRSILSIRRHMLDRFVLRPTRHRLPHEPKRREQVRCGNETIECFVQTFPAAGEDEADESPDLLVIKLPGTAGRAERSSEFPRPFLSELHSQLWTWNPPGYGGSSGRASLSTIPHAAAKFCEHLLGRFDRTKTRVWLVGNSLGCATAGYLASRKDLRADAMILRNPPPLVEIVKRAARQYPMGHLTDPVSESLPPEMNLLLTAPRADVPTVMFQSERDELVPPVSQLRVYDALPGPKRLYVMKGLGHAGIPSDDQQSQMAEHIRWLWDTTK